MRIVFAVYKTDNQHSLASRNLIGIATSQKKAIKICKEQSGKEGHDLETDHDQIFNLRSFKQTQGYQGEGEFHFDEELVNRLI